MSNKSDLVVLWWVYGNFVSLQQSLSSSKDTTSTVHKVNELNYYVNGGSESSQDFKNYPFINYARYNISGNNKDYPAEIWVDYDIPGETTYTKTGEKIYAKMYWGKVNNEYEKAYKFGELHNKVKDLIDSSKWKLSINEIQNLYWNIIVSLSKYQNNNWEFVTSLKSGWETEIKPKVDIYAKYIFDYKLANDWNFITWFNNEIIRQNNIVLSEKELQLWRSLTVAEKQELINEISRWVKDWIIKATSDYVMQYLELAKSLSNLGINDIYNGLGSVWNKMNNPVNTINQLASSLIWFKNDMSKSLNQLLWLWAYEKSVWWSYVWTTLWFIVWDPGSKLRKMVWDSNISNVSKKAIESLNKLQESYKLKVIAKYKSINGVDDIARISKESLVVAWNGWWAITIYWNQNTADSIINVLKSKGWKWSEVNTWVFRYDSADWIEAINMRTVSSSEQIFINDWYNVNTTIDLMKWDWKKMVKINNWEVKFILPIK